MTCNYNIKDSVRYLNKLNRMEQSGVYSVASYETVDPENFDFATIVEALEWVKQVGNVIHSPNGILLQLEDGTHTISQTEILKQGLSSISTNDLILFLKDTNLRIVGNGQNVVTIKIDSTLDDMVFVNSRILIEKTRIKILGTGANNVVNMISENSFINVDDCFLTDISINAIEKGRAKVSTTLFSNNNNLNKTILLASDDSFIESINNDFSNSDFNIEARRNSKILFKNNTNIAALSFVPVLNNRILDLSVVYDETIMV